MELILLKVCHLIQVISMYLYCTHMSWHVMTCTFFEDAITMILIFRDFAKIFWTFFASGFELGDST